jgi:hypothetical protein
MKSSNRWLNHSELSENFHSKSRWFHLTRVWIDRWTAVQRNETTKQVDFLSDYLRSLHLFEIMKFHLLGFLTIMLCTGLLSASAVARSKSESLWWLYFVPLLTAACAFGAFRFSSMVTMVSPKSFFSRVENMHSKTLGDTYHTSIINEMVSRKVTDPLDKVRGVQGLLNPQIQVILKSCMATSAPHIFSRGLPGSCCCER